MTDYTELIRSLRNCSNNRCAPCDCGWFDKYQVDESCKEIIMWKAADAIEALQAEVAFYKKRVCKLCGTCPDDMSDPNNCEIAGHGMWVGVNPLVDSVQCSICGGMLYSKELETPYCPYCGAKMEVQE